MDTPAPALAEEADDGRDDEREAEAEAEDGREEGAVWAVWAVWPVGLHLQVRHVYESDHTLHAKFGAEIVPL